MSDVVAVMTCRRTNSASRKLEVFLQIVSVNLKNLCFFLKSFENLFKKKKRNQKST